MLQRYLFRCDQDQIRHLVRLSCQQYYIPKQLVAHYLIHEILELQEFLFLLLLLHHLDHYHSTYRERLQCFVQPLLVY